MADDKDKKGFSGLSDLVSDVSGIDNLLKPEPEADTKLPTSKRSPQRSQSSALEPEWEVSNSCTSTEIPISGKNDGSSVGKWIFDIVGSLSVIGRWIFNIAYFLLLLWVGVLGGISLILALILGLIMLVEWLIGLISI